MCIRDRQADVDSNTDQRHAAQIALTASAVGLLAALIGLLVLFLSLIHI